MKYLAGIRFIIGLCILGLVMWHVYPSTILLGQLSEFFVSNVGSRFRTLLLQMAGASYMADDCARGDGNATCINIIHHLIGKWPFKTKKTGIQT